MLCTSVSVSNIVEKQEPVVMETPIVSSPIEVKTDEPEILEVIDDTLNEVTT